MGTLFLIVLFIILLGKGDTSVLWWAGGFLVLAVIGVLTGQVREKPKAKERPRLRIDHPHYYSADEYECAVCGTRFEKASMTCPHCGVRFNGTKTDEEEFLEEEDEMSYWDKEEGL